MYEVYEVGNDEPQPKGVTVYPLDLLVTREFIDQWSAHFEREDRVRESLGE